VGDGKCRAGKKFHRKFIRKTRHEGTLLLRVFIIIVVIKEIAKGKGYVGLGDIRSECSLRRMTY